MTNSEKQMRFLHILLAFGHFAEVPLKVVDIGLVLSNDHIAFMEEALRAIASEILRQPDQMPKLDRLGRMINEELDR